MIEFTFISRKMRKLKYHEKKLLKKVDFFNWEIDNNQHELKIMRKYRILKREQYTMYNKLSRFYQYKIIGRHLKVFSPSFYTELT